MSSRKETLAGAHPLLRECSECHNARRLLVSSRVAHSLPCQEQRVWGMRSQLGRVHRRSLITVVALLLGCAAGSDPIAPAPQDVIGCYELTLGAWSAPHESPDPPSSITLLDSNGTYLLEEGRTLARPNPVDAPMSFDMAWWSRVAEEKLEVVFSNSGYVGVRFSFEWTGMRWAGTAVAFTDVVPMDQATAPSSLAQALCS